MENRNDLVNSKNTLIEENKKSTQERQFCDSCNFQTSSAKTMTEHRNSHFCPICGLFLSLPGHMKTHLIKVHNYSNESLNCFKQFQCHICSKKYSSKGSLHNHKKTIHNQSLYVCEICGQSFKHSRLLSTHAVRHGEKKISCKECDASFFLGTELNKHVNSVHRKVKSYECPKCNRFFCQRSSLTHHLSQHTSDQSIVEMDLHLDEYVSNQSVKGESNRNSLLIAESPLSNLGLNNESASNASNITDVPYVSFHLDQTMTCNDYEDQVEINISFESNESSVVHNQIDISELSKEKPFDIDSVLNEHSNSSLFIKNSCDSSIQKQSQGRLENAIKGVRSKSFVQDVLYIDHFDEITPFNLSH